MGFEGSIARTADLSPAAHSGAGDERADAYVPAAEADDAADADRGLREACHDMRQPVAGVLALAGAALAEPGLPGVARLRLEQIIKQAEWLADMIQDWLRTAQPGDPSRSC
jgi:hypothetical protein